MMSKRFSGIALYSEAAYLLALLLLSLSVALLTAADFGVSMIVAPAYILSKKLGFLTFGQSEYVIQGLLFLVFCVCMRKVRGVYFVSFVTGLIYGGVLDAWRALVPLFNESITPVGSMPMGVRLLMFAVGVPLCSLSIAMFFHVYLYPQVYDFFVKGVSARYHLDRTRFKRLFDGSFFLLSCGMTLLFFRSFVGVGWGTVVMTLVNGVIIGWFDRLLTRWVRFVPLFPKAAAAFDLEDTPATDPAACRKEERVC